MGRAVAIGCQRFFWSSGLGASEAVAVMDRWTAARVSGVKWSKAAKLGFGIFWVVGWRLGFRVSV